MRQVTPLKWPSMKKYWNCSGSSGSPLSVSLEVTVPSSATETYLPLTPCSETLPSPLSRIWSRSRMPMSSSLLAHVVPSSQIETYLPLRDRSETVPSSLSIFPNFSPAGSLLTLISPASVSTRKPPRLLNQIVPTLKIRCRTPVMGAHCITVLSREPLKSEPSHSMRHVTQSLWPWKLARGWPVFSSQRMILPSAEPLHSEPSLASRHVIAAVCPCSLAMRAPLWASQSIIMASSDPLASTPSEANRHLTGPTWPCKVPSAAPHSPSHCMMVLSSEPLKRAPAQ
mmetsp:Transcript_59699/g.156936  ORF Transcript_59699/g.156936 Transcript_59699/m.156936 type:complete len:284 (-) Transcript_59699:231-1082(-)